VDHRRSSRVKLDYPLYKAAVVRSPAHEGLRAPIFPMVLRYCSKLCRLYLVAAGRVVDLLAGKRMSWRNRGRYMVRGIVW
jgi:hypothetical protein